MVSLAPHCTTLRALIVCLTDSAFSSPSSAKFIIVSSHLMLLLLC